MDWYNHVYGFQLAEIYTDRAQQRVAGTMKVVPLCCHLKRVAKKLYHCVQTYDIV